MTNSNDNADRPTGGKPRRKPMWNNTITMVGLFICAMAMMLLLTFGLFSVVAPAANPYVDIVGYLILPSLLIVGLVIVPFGILFKSWRLHRKFPEQRLEFHLPRIDLTDPQQRKAAKVLVIGTFVLLPVVGVSAYHGYHFTDSTEFCGQVCHSVMEPEATTYEFSAHARVSCAECHIGSGASWFVKSKLSGTRQVLAMWRESYSRPIAPAIQHLRPARETCERCHWPKKFFGAQLRELVYFRADENNTRQDIDMLVKTGGGGHEESMRAEGIHAHMAITGKVEYVATDDKLQVIPWVKYTNEAGEELIYRSDGRPSSDPRPEGDVRRLDCMDCHNRPAHKFQAPSDAVDLALEVGEMDTSLPFIKREAVAVLEKSYPDTDIAMEAIGEGLAAFYQENYPELWEGRRVAVNQAIDAVRKLYRQTTFPTMKVDWRTYPDNIGHKMFPGCFRCHAGEHVNQNGEKISHACDVCHLFLNPVDQGQGRTVVQRGDFVHPVELEGIHATMRCDKCHTGGSAPLPTCTGCHSDVTAFRAGTLEPFESFGIVPEPMNDVLDCAGCHDLSKPTTIEVIDVTCTDCHDDEEYKGMLAGWDAEARRLIEEAEARTDGPGLEMLKRLRRVGPLHNIDATRTITQALISGNAVRQDEHTAAAQP